MDHPQIGHFIQGLFQQNLNDLAIVSKIPTSLEVVLHFREFFAFQFLSWTKDLIRLKLLKQTHDISKGEVYEVDDTLLKILDDFEGHPDFYHRRLENVEDGNGKVIQCWTYFLPKFKPEMLQLDHLPTYHSKGSHGKPYNPSDDIDTVEDIM